MIKSFIYLCNAMAMPMCSLSLPHKLHYKLDHRIIKCVFASSHMLLDSINLSHDDEYPPFLGGI
jgi:hypothetical protein